jgi:hypothetical protein
VTFKTRYGDWHWDRPLVEGVGVVGRRMGRDAGRGRRAVVSGNGTSLAASQDSRFRRFKMSITGDVIGSDIQVGSESVLGNERLASGGGDGDAGSVGTVSAAGSGDAEGGRALGSVGSGLAG